MGINRDFIDAHYLVWVNLPGLANRGMAPRARFDDRLDVQMRIQICEHRAQG